MPGSVSLFRPASLVAAALFLNACGGGGGGGDAPAAPLSQRVSVDFAVADASGVLADPCAQPLQGLGSGAVNAKLQDLRFFVANVHLLTRGGTLVKLSLDTGNTEQLTLGSDTLALIDLRGATACDGSAGKAPVSGHRAVSGTVPAGDYVGAQFTLGVPEALNHVDPNNTTPPLDNTDLGWDWTAGKKHLMLELAPQAAGTVPAAYANGIALAGGGTATTWSLHLGNTCTSRADPANAANTLYECAVVNTRDIRLASFDPATQRVAIDLVKLLAGNDLRQDAGEAVGCMAAAADPECVDLWPALGGTVVVGTPATTQALGLSATWNVGAATAFRAVAK